MNLFEYQNLGECFNELRCDISPEEFFSLAEKENLGSEQVDNFDSYKTKMAEHVDVKLDKVTIASADFSKTKLHFIVNNHLFFGVMFKNLLFDMSIGGTKVANGMQAEHLVTLNPNTDTNVVITCKVDPIIAKRAIGKAVQETAGKLLKAFY